MNRNRLLVLGLGGALGLIVIISLVISLIPKKQSTQSTESISYTDAVTGQQFTDLPGESVSQQAGIVLPPSVNIRGFDTLAATLSSPQAGSVQTIMKQFLLARSGLSTVDAGIRNNRVSQPSNKSRTFILAVNNPQSVYEVTITILNEYQTIPDVTFKQIQ